GADAAIHAVHRPRLGGAVRALVPVGVASRPRVSGERLTGGARRRSVLWSGNDPVSVIFGPQKHLVSPDLGDHLREQLLVFGAGHRDRELHPRADPGVALTDP